MKKNFYHQFTQFQNSTNTKCEKRVFKKLKGLLHVTLTPVSRLIDLSVSRSEDESWIIIVWRLEIEKMHLING